MSTNNNFINNLLDESYQKYIKPVAESDGHYYRVFDNNCEDDRVVINGKIEKIVNLPKNLNEVLNIDCSCGNIVHIPMVNDIYIEYESIKQLIHIKELNINNFTSKLDLDEIKILSVKNSRNITYQDIIIQTNKEIIIIQIYKFKVPFESITHGAVIIYQNDSNNSNQNNTIYYTKNNSKLILNKIDDTNIIIDDNKKNKKYRKNKIFQEFITF
jgi:hypothetical protein